MQNRVPGLQGLPPLQGTTPILQAAVWGMLCAAAPPLPARSVYSHRCGQRHIFHCDVVASMFNSRAGQTALQRGCTAQKRSKLTSLHLLGGAVRRNSEWGTCWAQGLVTIATAVECGQLSWPWDLWELMSHTSNGVWSVMDSFGVQVLSHPLISDSVPLFCFSDPRT